MVHEGRGEGCHVPLTVGQSQKSTGCMMSIVPLRLQLLNLVGFPHFRCLHRHVDVKPVLCELEIIVLQG